MIKTIKIIVALYILAAVNNSADAQSWSLTGNAGTNGSTNFIGTTDNIPFKIRTNNAVRMTVNGSGKVGIGTTNPYSQLAVSVGSSAVVTRGIWSGQFTDLNLAATFGGRRARGTEAVPVAVASNDFTMGVIAQNFDGANYITNGSIGYRVTGAVTPGNVPGEWFFGASNSHDLNSFTNNTVRMVVQNSGNVGIGTIAPDNKLSVAGDADFSGKVGIGTIAPDGKLDVTDHSLTSLANFDGGNNMFITLKENGNYRGYFGSWSGAAEDVDFGTGANNLTGAVNFTIQGIPKMTITNSGNVGIGTLTPVYKLEVDADASFNNVRVGRGNGNLVSNLAVGNGTLNVNSTGDWNTATGFQSLSSNTTGYSNTAIGYQSLFANDGGGDNTATGTQSLLNNTTGVQNTANGGSALKENIAGSSNTASGYAALTNNTSGNNNTAFGKFALFTNEFGNNNTAIGYYADVAAAGLFSNSTAIGYNAKVAQSNSMVLGDTTTILVGIGTGKPSTRFHVKYNSSITQPQILLQESENDYARLSFRNTTGSSYWTIAGLNSTTNSNERLNFHNSTAGDIISLTGDGKVGIGTTNPSQKLTVFNGTSTGTYTMTGWVHTSDEKLKTNIKPLESSLDKILKLEGVSYNWKANPGDNNQIGFLAQQVEKVFPEVVVKDAEGNYSMAPQNLTAPIVEAIKEQQKLIVRKDEAIKSLQVSISNLENENTALKSRLDKFESALSQCCSSYEQKIISDNNSTTDAAKLEQNTPNPFSLSTVIKFYIPQYAGSGVIKVYSLDGAELKSIIVSTKGFGQTEISGKTLAAGTYTYMLLLDGKVVDTKQMVLTK